MGAGRKEGKISREQEIAVTYYYRVQYQSTYITSIVIQTWIYQGIIMEFIRKAGNGQDYRIGCLLRLL